MDRRKFYEKRCSHPRFVPIPFSLSVDQQLDYYQSGLLFSPKSIPLSHHPNHLHAEIELPNLLLNSLIVYRLVPLFEDSSPCAGKARTCHFSNIFQTDHVLCIPRCTTSSAPPTYFPSLRNALFPASPRRSSTFAHLTPFSCFRAVRTAYHAIARVQAESVCFWGMFPL